MTLMLMPIITSDRAVELHLYVSGNTGYNSKQKTTPTLSFTLVMLRLLLCQSFLLAGLLQITLLQ